MTAASRVTDREVVHHAVDSQQPGADLVSDGPTEWVFFIDRPTRGIHGTERRSIWQPSARYVEHIQGTWIRGSIYTRSDGARVYGYVYDAGSEGGSGMNRFAEVVLNRDQ
jgi:hypothetical protein